MPQPTLQEFSIEHIERLDMSVVHAQVWFFLKRYDGSVVRIAISNPDRTADLPPRIHIEASQK